MEILSFVLDVAGEIVKTLVVDFVSGKSQKVIQDAVAEQVSTALAKYPSPNAVSSETIAQQVIEQILLLTSKPSCPVIFQDGEFRLREQLSHKPRLVSPKKWVKQEIQARLSQLERAIMERKKEIGEISSKLIVNSTLPPISPEPPDIPTLGNEHTLEKPRQDWVQRLRELTDRIEERRNQELKNLDVEQENDDVHS